ncbi:hypothetical protein CR513_09736, partial [Mucuna pruriens]
MQTGRLRANNSDDHHTDQVQIKGQSNLEFQQTMNSSNLQFQQNMSAIVQDFKMQVSQLATSISQLQSTESGNLPSQTIPNPRGNASVHHSTTIGDCPFADAMLDLGASINFMLTSIYKSLNCGDLEPTGITIQLANRSVVQPLSVLEDVLVQVDKLIFLADFYVLDMEDDTPGKWSTLILG